MKALDKAVPGVIATLQAFMDSVKQRILPKDIIEVAPRPTRIKDEPLLRAALPKPDGAEVSYGLSGENVGLTSAQKRVINSIAWWSKVGRHPVERVRAAVFAGYSPKASTFGVYIAELVKKGLVFSEPGKVGLTDDGLAAADIPANPTRDDLKKVRAVPVRRRRKRYSTRYTRNTRTILIDPILRTNSASRQPQALLVYILPQLAVMD